MSIGACAVPGQEDAGDGALDRTELRVHLQQEAVVADGCLGHVDEASAMSRGATAHAQHHQVGRHLQLPSEGQRVA